MIKEASIVAAAAAVAALQKRDGKERNKNQEDSVHGEQLA